MLFLLGLLVWITVSFKQMGAKLTLTLALPKNEAGEAVADCRTILTQSQFTPLWFQCSLNYRTLSSKPQPIIDLTCPATLPPTPPGPPPTHQPDQGPLQQLHGAVHLTH